MAEQISRIDDAWSTRWERARRRLRQNAESELDLDRVWSSALGEGPSDGDVEHHAIDQLSNVGFRDCLLIGRGSSSLVFRACEAETDRRVAVKVLTTEDWTDAARERFLREVMVASQLSHDHLVRVLRGGVLPRRWPYVVMECIEGRSLAEHLEEDGPLVPPEAARVALQLAGGLEALHAAGWIHRDIKPANVLVSGVEAKALLADFGLIRPLCPGGTVTSCDVIPGTPYYMAPERFRPELECDRRADVYALGVLLYEMLTGDVPFRGSLPELIAQTLYGSVDWEQLVRRGVPFELIRIVRRAMARQPTRRYPSAAAMADDLRAWLRGDELPSLCRRRHWNNPRRACQVALGFLLSLACVSWSEGAGRTSLPLSRTGRTAESSAPVSAPEPALRTPQDSAAAMAISWIAHQRQAADPRPSSQRRVALQAMLRLIDSVETAPLPPDIDPREFEAGLALMRAHLYWQLGEGDRVLHCARTAATFYDSLAAQRLADTEAGTSTGADDLRPLESAARAERLMAQGYGLENNRAASERHAARAVYWSRAANRMGNGAVAVRLPLANNLILWATTAESPGGDLSGRRRLASAVALLQSLPEANTTRHPSYAGEVASTYAEAARASTRLGLASQAVHCWRQALAWRPLPPQPMDPATLFETSQWLADAADAEQASGSVSRADELRRKALQMVQQLLAEDGKFDSYTQLKARLLRSLGR